MLPLLQVEMQSLPVQDLALWPIHCSQEDLYEGHKAHPVPMPENGHNSVFIPGQCSCASQLLHLSQGRWAEGSAFVTETGFLC